MAPLCGISPSVCWAEFFFSILRPNSHRTRTRCATLRKHMGPVVINGSIHTACKQHQRKNVPICMRVASRVLCELGLSYFPPTNAPLPAKYNCTSIFEAQLRKLHICQSRVYITDTCALATCDTMLRSILVSCLWTSFDVLPMVRNAAIRTRIRCR